MLFGKNKPYIDVFISSDERIRTFYVDVDSEELIWHRDKKDRIIKSLVESDWMFQFDNQMPFMINKTQEIFIEKLSYHRIIKGTSNLILQIKEV